MENRATIVTQIKSYLLENFLFGYTEEELSNDDSFLEMGVLDSTGIMEIVAFLEQKFNIDVNDDEIIPDNLDTINLMVSYVMKKVNN